MKRLVIGLALAGGAIAAPAMALAQAHSATAYPRAGADTEDRPPALGARPDFLIRPQERSR